MFVILGKTASGKSTILNELCKRGYKRITTYTTRPRRSSESENAYHFISEDEFIKKLDDGFFAEWYFCKTSDGDWFYGSSLEDYKKADDKTIVILNPPGFSQITEDDSVKLPGNGIKSIYIYSNIPTIRQRLDKRGDKKEEIERRIETDNLMFKGLETKVNKIVYNGMYDELDHVVDKLISIMEVL